MDLLLQPERTLSLNQRAIDAGDSQLCTHRKPEAISIVVTDNTPSEYSGAARDHALSGLLFAYGIAPG